VIQTRGTTQEVVGFQDWINQEKSRAAKIARRHHRTWLLLAQVVYELPSLLYLALGVKEKIRCWGNVGEIEGIETEEHLRKDRLVHEGVSVPQRLQLHRYYDWKRAAEILHGNEGRVSWNPSGVHMKVLRSFARVSPRMPVPGNVRNVK